MQVLRFHSQKDEDRFYSPLPFTYFLLRGWKRTLELNRARAGAARGSGAGGVPSRQRSTTTANGQRGAVPPEPPRAAAFMRRTRPGPGARRGGAVRAAGVRAEPRGGGGGRCLSTWPRLQGGRRRVPPSGASAIVSVCAV